MGLVFQDPFSVLNPSLRVGAQIGEGLVAHRGLTRAAALARAIDLLAEVGIADARAVADAYPHELSGGMSSMLCAVALSSSIKRTRIVFLSSRLQCGARCPMFEEASDGPTAKPLLAS